MPKETIRRPSRTERAFDSLVQDIVFNESDLVLLQPFSSGGSLGNFQAPKKHFKDTRLLYGKKFSPSRYERDMKSFFRWAIQGTGDLSRGDRDELPYMNLSLRYKTPAEDGSNRNPHKLEVEFTAYGGKDSDIKYFIFRKTFHSTISENKLSVYLSDEGTKKVLKKLGVLKEKDHKGVELMWNNSKNTFDVILDKKGTVVETSIGTMNINELGNLGIEDLPYEIFLDDGMSGLSFNYKGKKIKVEIPFVESTDIKQNILQGGPMVPVSIKADSEKIF